MTSYSLFVDFSASKLFFLYNCPKRMERGNKMSRFGDILAELREDRGLNQKQLAEEFHVSNSSISSLETGYRVPSVEMLVNLAAYFDVTTDYLLGLSDSSLSPSVLSKRIAQEVTAAELISMIESLTLQQKSALILVLKDMSIVADLVKKASPSGER